MEYEDKWADKRRIIHKNKKAVKPEKKKEKNNEKHIAETDEKQEILSPKWEYLHKLVKGSLCQMKEKTRFYSEKHFGKNWTSEFMSEVEYLSEDILSSNFLPDERIEILLKYLFIIQESL